MASSRPSSNPSPFSTTRSADSSVATPFADGRQSWGSLPFGMSTSTRAESPTASRTMAPSTGVVATISGAFADAAVVVGDPSPASPPQAATPSGAMITIAAAAARNLLVTSMDASLH